MVNNSNSKSYGDIHIYRYNTYHYVKRFQWVTQVFCYLDRYSVRGPFLITQYVVIYKAVWSVDAIAIFCSKLKIIVFSHAFDLSKYRFFKRKRLQTTSFTMFSMCVTIFMIFFFMQLKLSSWKYGKKVK